MISAIYQPRSGFRDYQIEPEQVTILGFVYGEYEPRYQLNGTKTCVLAVAADSQGNLFQTELGSLRIETESTPSQA